MCRYRRCPVLGVAVVVCVSGLWLWGAATPVWAQGPSESLLPSTTKGFVSIPDMDEARRRWDATQWGQLAADAKMKPFVADLNRQMMKRIADTGVRLGIGWEDVENVYGGEVCVASIQPPVKLRQQHSIALLVDVTGHLEQANKLLDKVKKNLKADGAKESPKTIAGVKTLELNVPAKKPGQRSYQAYYTIVDNWLVAVDHKSIAQDILSRFGKQKGAAASANLASAKAFQRVMKESRRHLGDIKPHARWFVEPLGFAKVAQSSRGRRRSGTRDLIRLLTTQGFDAVQGVGGYFVLATGEYEMMHYTYAYAPGDADKTHKYRLAARMMDFPNGPLREPQSWIPRELAAYASFNMKTKESFEYAKSLVNALNGADETDDYFEDFLRSLKTDAQGPRVDMRKDLVHRLANRAVVFSDYRQPITTKSERVMLAIECADLEMVSRSINQLMRIERNAKRRTHEGYTIWEIIDPQNKADRRSGGNISRNRFRNQPRGRRAINGPKLGANARVPNSAICVAHGHLLVSTHVDFIIDVLNKANPEGSLADAADYQLVQDHLQKLGTGEDSMRFFSRTDEEFRANYELLRQGKMPQSETMLGQLLNLVFGSGDRRVVRRQQIDAAKMPPYDVARRYLGPAGIYVHSEDHGWFIGGCFLSKP